MSGCSSSPTNNGDSNEKLHLIWEYAYDLDGGAPRVKPLIHENTIITSGDNNITSLQVNNGDIKWKTPLNHHTSLTNRSFGIADDLIVGSVLKRLIAWNLTTGTERWSISFKDNLTFADLSGVGIADDYFISFGTNGELYKTSKNGELEVDWIGIRTYESSFFNGNLLLTHRSPPADGEIQYGAVQSFDFESMELNWIFEKHGFMYATRVAPFIENNIVYFGTADGASNLKSGFFALNAQTGEEIWRREGIFTYSAVMEGDYIYVNDAAGIFKLRKSDGGIEWYSDFEAGAGTGPIAYGYGYLYAPHSGTMHIVDAESGEIVHRMSPPDGSFFWLVTADAGRIFAQSSRHLYAFAPWGHKQPLEE